MKTIRYILITCLVLASSACVSQRYASNETVTVNAYSDDISYNLDLQAVAAAFGEARTLEEFERMINDYNSQISNLDLNQDGYVDYLRVVEATDNNANVVLIQAVLGQDIYQDVASIVAERRGTQDVRVQFVGNSYLYGPDYYFTPVFVSRPPIYSYFWTPGIALWRSPYYWGYYPTFYHTHAPLRRDAYYSHINTYLGNNSYYRRARYNRSVTYSGYNNLRSGISRNDYSTRYPEASFERRVATPTRSASSTTSSSSRTSTIKNASQLPNTRSTTSTRSSSTGRTNATNSSSSTRSSGRTTTTSQGSNSNNSSTTRGTSGSSTRSSGSSTTRSSSGSSTTRSSGSSTTRSSGSSTRSNSSSTRSNSSSTSTRSSSGSSTRSSSSSSSSRGTGRTR